MELVRQKNVATIIVFPLVDADGDPVSGATGLDSEIDAWSDGAAPDGYTDCTNEAAEVGTSGSYSLSLTQAEMNVDYVIVQIKSNAKTQWILIRTMVGDPLNAATTDLAVASVTGAVASVTGNVGGNVTGSVGSVVGAVASVTGNVGGNVTGSVGSIGTGGIAAASFAAGAIDAAAIAASAIGASEIANDAITAAKIATGAIDADALAADAVDEIWDETIGDGTLTGRQALRVAVAALAAKLSGAATATVTIRNAADSQDVIVATVDASGNRTAITLTP